MTKKVLILPMLLLAMGWGKEMENYLLETQVTTATRTQTPIEKAPGNVTLVTSQEIKERSPQKVSDFIKNHEGIHIPNDAGLIPRPTIKIRGIGNGTLVMLDGVILSDLEGENRILDELSLYDVIKVEVVRGPFSSLYGTGAIGGVVNFITSMPTKFESQAFIGYGNGFKDNQADSNLVRGYMSIGNAFLDRRLRLKASYGFTSSGGYPSVPAFGDKKSFDKLSSITGYDIDKAGHYLAGDIGRREYALNDGRFKLEYDWNDRDTTSMSASISNHRYSFVDINSTLKNSKNQFIYGNDEYSPFIGTGYGGRGSYTHYIASISHTHNFNDDSELKAIFSTVNLYSWWLDALQGSSPEPTLAGGTGFSQDIYTSSNYLDLVYDKIFYKHLLTLALQGRYLQLDQLNYGLSDWRVRRYDLGLSKAFGGKALLVAGFVQVDSNWTENLVTTLGLRYDYWQNFANYSEAAGIKTPQRNVTQNSFSPKASINYNLLNFVILKSSLGTAFRVPTLREIFRISTTATQWLNNPNLKPEMGFSFDIGGEFNMPKNGLLKLYYFQTELSNLIYRSGDGNSASPFQNKNAGHGRINGIEVGYFQPIMKLLSLNTSYTWTNAKIISNPANKKTEGKFIPNTPEHMLHMALLYGRGDTRGFYGSIEGNFQTASYNNDVNSPILKHTFKHHDMQLRFDARIGYEFANAWGLSVSFLNFTNNRYYDLYQVAGASFFAQISAKF